jgi:quercetin dioxygenase-like cupin family protein
LAEKHIDELLSQHLGLRAMNVYRLSTLLCASLFVVACGGSPEPPAVSPPSAPAAPTAPAVPATPAAPTADAPAAAAPATPPAAEAKSLDPIDVGPTIYKKVFENENARMMEVTFKVGDKIARHKHPDHVAYVVSGGKLKVTGADGKAQDFDLKAGQAMFLPAQEHSAENVGSSEVKLVVVELGAKAPTAAPAGADPIKAGPTIYKKVFENDRVRVLEVTFKKGAKITAHAHPDHLAYVLQPGKLKISPDKGAAQEAELKAGMGMFMPAQAHSAENPGTSEVKVVVVELRK